MRTKQGQELKKTISLDPEVGSAIFTEEGK
jgi:hypothetical protein